MNECDVLIVGAGPTGLTAAGDLARAGRSVTVLERRPSINPASRAFATMPRTLELLQARGLADDVIATGHLAAGVTIFGGAHIAMSHLRTAPRSILNTPQVNVDTALTRYAEGQGGEIRRGLEVVALEQDADGVTVTARPAEDADAEPVRWRARYVIGADGAHSTVRDLLGVGFPGHTVLSSIALADVKLRNGPDGQGLTVGSTREVFALLAPYEPRDADGAWYRAMVWDRGKQLPDSASVDPAEVADVLTRAMGVDHDLLEISWRSRFHCDERQVARYRHGRVFLAGDAAHVHAPMGGQGMNTGIQDAANLAWKIDAVLGGADDSVLDTYHAERHPIGRRVLLQSGLMARGITLHPRPARALRNLVVPRLLRIPRVRDAIAGSLAGTTLHYRRRRHERPLVGTRATEIPLTEGRLLDLHRDGGFVLIRERGAAETPHPGVDLLQAQRCDDGPAVLVRPDDYIAWTGPSADRAGWASVLHAWTGRCADATPLPLR